MGVELDNWSMVHLPEASPLKKIDAPSLRKH